MADTTEEEVRRCPKCKEPGVKTGSKPSKSVRGATLQNFMCMNNRCRWFKTEWVIQVNADGTVPPPIDRHDKVTSRVDPALAAQVQANAERLLQQSREQGEIAARQRN